MPRRTIYKAKRTGNLFNTGREAIEDNKRYLSDVEYRYNIKGSKIKRPALYKIPFIESKRRVLTNAGLATGAVISENLLDTIAKYANMAGLPVKTALGLATKESTLGNPTDDTSIYKILNEENVKRFKEQGTGTHINQGSDILPRDLINFYKDENDPYTDAIRYAQRKASANDTEGYRTLLKQGERYADSRVKDYEEQYGNNNMFYNAFKSYKEHPNQYNPGQPNYPQLVEQRGNEVWGSPEVQNWYKGYKRSLELGGKKLK